MEKEQLKNSEIIVKICPHTKKLVLAQVVNDEILCLHSDTVEQDYQQVINWIKQQNEK